MCEEDVSEFLSESGVKRINPYHVIESRHDPEFTARRQHVIEQLELGKLLERKVTALSNGERRKVTIARALLKNPRLLILDNPFAGLDERFRGRLANDLEKLMQGDLRVLMVGYESGNQDILDRIMTLRREWGTTLVIISHNMEDIARLCDRIFVLADGKTVLSGTPREVFAERSRVESFGLGVPQVTAAMQELRELGLPVRGNVLTVEEAEQVLANGRI